MSAWPLLVAGAAILAFAWLGPLPGLVHASFTAHMALHMTVVGAGAPLLAAGLARARDWPMRDWPGRSWPGRGWPGRGWPEHGWPALTLAASLMDFAVVWIWHAPVLHHASRNDGAILALEQASFAAAALLLWLTALTGPPLAGAMALFLTSMHMMLLGALLGLAPRLLYAGHGMHPPSGMDPLTDQQIGGVIMMALGGVIYFGAATHRAARSLHAWAGR
jgi:putative membrane protein